jgi:hypothetical protein
MPASRAGAPTAPTGAGTLLALVLIAAGIVVRVLAILHLRVNTDEPQHLHVAWAWTQGLLPYRDVFDNHTPLFSLLMSPWLSLAGERPDIVVVMRLAMVPLVLIALGATWIVARRLFSPRVALWAVALAAVNPEFMRASVEYRTDQLWMASWLSALAVLVSGRPSRGRALAAGSLLGVAVATSMKTSLLLVSMVVAVVATGALLASEGRRVQVRALAGRAAMALFGMTLLPGALAAYFALHGAWPQLLYGVLWHNLVPGLGMWRSAPLRPLLLVVGAPTLWWIARALVRNAPEPRLGALRAALLITTGLSHGLIEGFWPLVTRADLLPLLPIEFVFLAALMLALPEAAMRRAPRARALAHALAWAPASLLAVLTAAAATIDPVWQDRTQSDVALMRQVLQDTSPGDLVMDGKGEAIFRRRPYYLALETITEERFHLGLLRDDIPERLIASGTPVLVQQNLTPFPPRARRFIESYYLPVGWLRVVGTRLDPPPGDAKTPRDFVVEIPQRYALVDPAGQAHGWLDGRRYERPRMLARGRHSFRARPGEGPVVLVWAGALEHGISPFKPPSLLDGTRLEPAY